MQLLQASAQVSPERKREALATLRELALRQPPAEQPAYALAEALFSASYLGGPPPPAADRPLLLQAGAALQRAASQLDRSDRSAEALLCLALAHQQEPRKELLARMLGIALSRALHEDVVQILSALLRLETERPRRKEHWLSLVKALEESLSRHSDAADAYGAAAVEFPEYPDFLAGQARCLEAARRYDELLAVIYRQIATEKSESRLALLHTRLGNLLETVLRNDVRAMEHYRTAVRLAPSFEPPIQGLLALAERRGEWATVAEVLKIRLRTEVRPKERATVLTRLGEVVAQRLKDPTKALGYLERAIREYPRGLPARLLLLELLCEQREFARAERFATPPDATDAQALNPVQLARLCQIRARVAAERARPHEALECLTLAVEVAPKPKAVLEDLIALIRQHEPEAVPPEVLGRKARDWERDQEPELAALALLAEGLLLQHLGRVEAAEESLKKAWALAPKQPAFAEALADLYYHQRRLREAAETYQAAAIAGHPDEARLTVRAAQVFSEHLGDHARALELLRELRTRGAASSESCLYAAALALQEGRLDEARLSLELAGAWVPPDRQHILQSLRVELSRVSGGAPQAVSSLQAEAARAGDERSLRMLAADCIAQGRDRVLDAIVGSMPRERMPPALRVLGDSWRRAGNNEKALGYYRRALDAAGGHNLEALEGMSLIAPQEALHGLEVMLSADPFNGRGLSLLSTLLAATGEAQRAQSLYQLSSTFQDGPGETPIPSFERFWGELDVIDPFLSLIVLLHHAAPLAFDPREAAIASQSREVSLPTPVKEALQQVCAKGPTGVPAVLLHPNVGADPVTLHKPLAIVVSPLLLRPEMPEGALLFTLLRGVAQLGLGVGAMTYLAPYQLDVLAEALRTAASPESTGASPTSAASLVAGVLDIAPEVAESVIRDATYHPGAYSADPLHARRGLDGTVLRAALGATRGLVAALSSLSLLPPPTIAFQATKGRWLRQLARLPLARAAMGYTLSDHFAKLQAQP